MEWIRAFLGIFTFVVVSVGIPLVLILALLGFFIKSLWIRVLLAFLIWGTILNSLPGPHYMPKWRIKTYQQMIDLRRIGLAWLSYKSDQECNGDAQHAIPERLSQLIPDYLTREDLKYFFDDRGGTLKALCDKAATDPTEVDRNGRFDYFAGKVGWMVAASKAPIENGASTKIPGHQNKRFRVILEMNGTAGIWPEEEYQRRLSLGVTEAR